MGITRPSLYAAFGNKDSLFRKALDLYEREKLAYLRTAMDQPTARGVAETMLRGTVDNVTSTDEPHGCMGVITSVACGPEAQSVREEVVKRGEVAKIAITERFERAKVEGDLPAARRSRRIDAGSRRHAPGNLGSGEPGRDPRRARPASRKRPRFVAERLNL